MGIKQNIQKYDLKRTTLSSLIHNKRTTEWCGIIQIGKRLQLLTRAHEVDVTLFGNGINKKIFKNDLDIFIYHDVLWCIYNILRFAE